jgi:hypothetical protein
VNTNGIIRNYILTGTVIKRWIVHIL